MAYNEKPYKNKDEIIKEKYSNKINKKYEN